MEFTPFPKMARLSREIVITEKLDGTNAQVNIELLEDCFDVPADKTILAVRHTDEGKLLLRAGSRTRWVVPGDDNYGFAGWVQRNYEDLFTLGHGAHFGEWWGKGIQRGYGLDEKRFSLFNVSRWDDPESRPKCCHVVPTVYRGDFTTSDVDTALYLLHNYGSQAAPGFMNPEGIIVFHTAANLGFKKTIKDDEVPKAVAEKRALKAAAA